MNVERLVQFHIAALAILGAVLLGACQPQSTMPALVVFSAIASLIFTDILNWFRLNRIVANLAALVALSASVGDFLDPSSQQSQLLAIANLLIYLQVVLFFQQKSHRIYWQLSVLSLLQVVVAAALHVGFEFGALLTVYIAVAISTLTFFFVHRETSRITGAGTGDGSADGRSAAAAAPSPSPSTSPLWKRVCGERPKAAADATRAGLTKQLLGWGFLKQIGAMGSMTVLFTLVLFFVAPRPESSSRDQEQVTRDVVGFSTEITLNELGRVLQSSEPVLRISFREPESGAPYRVYGDPYLRGSVLTHYLIDGDGVARWRKRSFVAQTPTAADRGASNVEWEPYLALWLQRRPEYQPLSPPPPIVGLVREDFVLEPIDETVLFGTFPVYSLPSTSEDIRLERHTRQLLRRPRYSVKRRGEYRYSLATTAFRGGLQLDVTPHDTRLSDPRDQWFLEFEKRECLNFDSSQFPRLQAVADEIAATQPAGTSRANLARTLRNHFHINGLYRYSLDFRSLPRTRGIDPIEDFVANHRTGHCEYFASALAIMLRSQGIPSRLVIGFKGGEFNSLGNYYQVRQLNAHAWVEAYLEPADVVHEVPPGTDISPAGGWMRLDPTPGSDTDTAAQVEESLRDRIDDALDYAQLLWADYVLGMSARRQRETIFEPVSRRASTTNWSELLTRISAQQGSFLRRLPESWTYGMGVAGWLVLAALIFAGWLLWRRRRLAKEPLGLSLRRIAARLSGRAWTAGENGHAQSVKFLQRLESLGNQLGIRRGVCQTHRDFAGDFAARLANLTTAAIPLAAPRQIVDAFYRVRFGEQLLDKAEQADIDAGLSEIEQALAASRNGRTHASPETTVAP